MYLPAEGSRSEPKGKRKSREQVPLYVAGISKLKSVVLEAEMVAEKELPNDILGASGEVGTMRCGNWKLPDEMSVGQVAGIGEVGVEGVDDSFIAEDTSNGTTGERRFPAASQDFASVFSQRGWQPVLSAFEFL